jgi:membrane protease YdiL (CAAX protease family)
MPARHSGLLTTCAAVAGLLVPVLAQEVFLLGYGHARLSDVFSPRAVAIAIAVLFVIAHLRHAQSGALGLAFLLAMAWQGLWWSAARSCGKGIAPLMLAHAALLLLYERPALGVVLLLLIGVTVLLRARLWLTSIVDPFRAGNVGKS